MFNLILMVILGQGASRTRPQTFPPAVFDEGERLATSGQRPSIYILKDSAKNWIAAKTNNRDLDAPTRWPKDVLEVAKLYSKDGHIVFVVFLRGPRSGDWDDTSRFAFRMDGSLAMCKEVYTSRVPHVGQVRWQTERTLLGGMHKASTLAYDLKGNLLPDRIGEKLIDQANRTLGRHWEPRTVSALPFTKIPTR